MGPQLKVTSGDTFNGFHMTFKNGWTVSVQFGNGSYAEHHEGFERDQPEFAEILMGKLHKQFSCDSTSAEMWSYHEDYDRNKEDLLPTEKERKDYYLAHHYPKDPIGWQTPDEVAVFIKKVSNLPLPSLRIMGFEARKEENDE
tara:strand:+ start:217 stop:645 length:429 start_codon:yes stop_codon:yes gene_type:complete